jgi:hypothetical protein
MPTQDPRPGVTFEVEYRVIGHSNAAANFYFLEEVEYFAFEEDDEGLLLLLTEECRQELRPAIEPLVDFLKVDPDDPESHPQVESLQTST